MDKDLVIKAVGQKKLDNAMHVQYHTEMYGILSSADQAKTGLPADVMTEYNTNLTQEVDINREAQADALTADLLVADRERDRAVQYLFGVVRNAQLSPDEATREAAEMLSIVVHPYKGLPAESVDRETALILGLLVDLKKPALTAMPAKIEALNKAFAELATKRSDKRATTKLPLATEIRPKTDAAYERLLFTLRSNYLFGQAPIEKAAIEALAVRLNERATEIDTAYRQSAAQKRAAAAKKPKQPKEPKEPKDPKEPKEPKKPADPKEPKEPKKPEKPGSGDDIHVPSEPPKKPEDKDKPGGGTGGGEQPGGSPAA